MLVKFYTAYLNNPIFKSLKQGVNMRSVILAFLMLVSASCVTSSGTKVKEVMPGVFEIMVWDGELCRGRRDDCQDKLLPILTERVKMRCPTENVKISACQTKHRPSGTRLTCLAKCL